MLVAKKGNSFRERIMKKGKKTEGKIRIPAQTAGPLPSWGPALIKAGSLFKCLFETITLFLADDVAFNSSCLVASELEACRPRLESTSFGGRFSSDPFLESCLLLLRAEGSEV